MCRYRAVQVVPSDAVSDNWSVEIGCITDNAEKLLVTKKNQNGPASSFSLCSPCLFLRVSHKSNLDRETARQWISLPER